MATREFKIVVRPDHAPEMVKAELSVKGDGIWAPEVSIGVYKWDDMEGIHAHVEARNWIGEDHKCGSIYLHYDTVKEGWEAFQKLRTLFGLEGV